MSKTKTPQPNAEFPFLMTAKIEEQSDGSYSVEFAIENKLAFKLTLDTYGEAIDALTKWMEYHL